MFISSYSTYIDTTSTKRTQNERKESVKKTAKPFVLQATKAPNKNISINNTLPLNYISKYKILNNQQELQKQELANNPAKMKFTKISSINSAQIAYGENSKMFSLLVKPKPALNQTPKLDKSLPQLIQKGQASAMKAIMVNTYIKNENYYKITA